MGQSCPGLCRGLTCVLPHSERTAGVGGGQGQPSLGVGVPNHQGPGLVCVCLILHVDIAEDLCPHMTPKTHKYGIPGWDQYFRWAQ